MRRRISASLVIPLVIPLVVLAACGGSDDASSDDAPVESVGGTGGDGPEPTPTGGGSEATDGSDGSSSQAEVASMFLTFSDETGLPLRAECVNEMAAEFSDADAEAIASAGMTGEPDVSAQADELAEAILAECRDSSEYVRTFAESLKESTPTLDVECVVDAVGDAPVEDVNQAVIDSVEGCSG